MNSCTILYDTSTGIVKSKSPACHFLTQRTQQKQPLLPGPVKHKTVYYGTVQMF